MKPAHWQRVREVFLGALELPPEARAAFVERECGGDDELLLEVRRLIGASDESGFLEPPSPEHLAESLRAVAGPAPGSLLGGYRLLAEIGSGGMGVVYRAEHLASGRHVAVKVLPTGLHLRPQAVERFKREANAASRLSHPNIVPVLDFGREEGCYFYAMELVEGPSLAQLLVERRADTGSSSGRAPIDLSDPRACAELAALLADALAHAHAHGVIHRDVKPHNVLVDPSGTPRLVDFGLARDAEVSGITREGEVAGTPHYMSPEQARAQLDRIDERTDIYSLGVVLYEMLTLRRPFEGGTSQEVTYKIAHSRSRPARAVRATVPAPLSTVCEQAMRRVPEDRYASAAVMAADLRRWLAGEPVRARRPSLVARLRERAAEPRALLRAGPWVLLGGLGLGWAWNEGNDLLAERSRMPLLRLDLSELQPPVRLEVARSGDVPRDFGPFEPLRVLHEAAAQVRLEPGSQLLRVVDAQGVSDEFSLQFAPGQVVALRPRGVPDDDARMVVVPETLVRVPRCFVVPRDVEVRVRAFRIDRDPVTNAQYRRFVEATGHKAPRGWPEPGQPGPSTDWDDLPVHYVSSADAQAYAAWVGKRLPTLWEWLALSGPGDAARTVASVIGEGEGLAEGVLRMSSGSTPDWTQAYLQHARPVRADGGIPQGPYGLQHVFGNVACWTDTPTWRLDDDGNSILDEGSRVAMGCSWNWTKPLVLSSKLHDAVGVSTFENMSPGNGIRCAESLPP